MTSEPNVSETQRKLLASIQTEGVAVAYAAALALCKDQKAPANARATASSIIFRVAGYFSDRERAPIREPHEMSADELQTEIGRLYARSRSADKAASIFD